MSSETLPRVVVITGPSATGKTTLARDVAARAGLPLFVKDTFKEMMFDIVAGDVGGRYEEISLEQSHLLGRLTFGCMAIALESLVVSGVGGIFEANFDSRLFSPVLAALRHRHPFRMIQANLFCDPEVRAARFLRREETDRHPGHGGLRHLGALPPVAERASSFAPLISAEGDLLFTINTTDFATADFDGFFAALTGTGEERRNTPS